MPFELFGGTGSSSGSSSTSIIQSPSTSNIATGDYSPFILNRPQGDYVYSPNANDDTISQFSRNSTTGALTALAPATVACLQTTNNAASAIAPNGSWLYVLDYTTGVVRPFSVNTGTGQLTALATVTCATGNICGIVISSDSAFLYVFSTAGSCIYQFSIAAGTGLLTPLGTPSVAVTGGESNPTNAIYLHSSGMFIYGASALGTWINRWTRNTTTGLLTAAAGTNAGVGFTAEGAGVVGNYVYVGDSIANGRGIRYYSVNVTTGVLTLNGTYADGDLSSFITSSADATYFFNTTSNGLFIKQYLVGASGVPVLLASIAFAGGALPYGTVIQGSNIYVVNIPTNTIYVYATTSSTSAGLEPDYRTTGPGYLKQTALGSPITVAALSGITTTELSATAGIVSGQIAGLSLSKLTAGTLTTALSLDYGSAAGTGTITAGSNQILNTSGGLSYNVKTTEAHQLYVDNVLCFSVIKLAGIPVVSSLGALSVAADISVGTGTMLNWGATAGTGTVTAGSTQILNTSAGLAVNVQTGKTMVLGVNNVARVTIDAALITIGSTLRFGSSGTGTGTQTEIYATSAAGALNLNVPTGQGVNLRIAGSGFHTLNANGYTVATASGTITGAVRGLYTISTGLALNVETGSTAGVYVNNAVQQTFGVNGITFNTAAGTVTAATRGIYQMSTGLFINTPSATDHRLGVNGVSVFAVGDTSLTLAEAMNLIIGTTTGTKICTATSQKLGFWNATPIVQPAGANQAAITDSTGGTAGFTLSDVGAVPTQANINDNFASLNRQVDAIRTALVNAGIIKGAA